MKKSLLYFSILIIVSNILIIGVGYITSITFIGRFMGGLMAVGTDPIILILEVLLNIGLEAKPLKLSVVYLPMIGVLFLTMLVHVVLGTKKVIVDVVRFDIFLIIPALIIIVISIFKPRN